MPVLEVFDKKPKIHKTCYISPKATIIGDVTIEEYSSVWPGASIRGDLAPIKIGKRVSIQDNVVIHVSIDKPVEVGDNVVIGHQATLHSCRIKNNALIGIGSIILDGAVIEDEAIIAAGAVVTEGTLIPRRSLAAGVPAKIIKQLNQHHIDAIIRGVEVYVRLTEEYKKAELKEGF